MSDIFKVIADPKARLVLETIADKPGSSASKVAEHSGLKSEQASTVIAGLVEAKLLKSTGSGTSKKYSLNAKGFGPYVAWLAKVAETQAVANLEMQLMDLGEKIGNAVADGSTWVSKQIGTNIDADPKKWAKELGRILADFKKEVQSQVLEVKKDAKKIATEVKRRVKR